MKIYKMLSFTLAASLWASQALAGNYYAAAVNGEYTMFVDLDTYKSLSASLKRIWIVSTSNSGNPAYRVVLEEYDCIQETNRALSLTAYNDRGDALTSNDQPGPTRPIPPSTLGAGVLKTVCDLETVDRRFVFKFESPLELYTVFKGVNANGPLK